ncbi:hypothetical protein Tco_1473932 [Tanacetum coccineum]
MICDIGLSEIRSEFIAPVLHAFVLQSFWGVKTAMFYNWTQVGINNHEETIMMMSTNDDDVEKDEEDEEEEEHLAPADPSAVPTDDPVPSS